MGGQDESEGSGGGAGVPLTGGQSGGAGGGTMVGDLVEKIVRQGLGTGGIIGMMAKGMWERRDVRAAAARYSAALRDLADRVDAFAEAEAAEYDRAQQGLPPYESAQDYRRAMAAMVAYSDASSRLEDASRAYSDARFYAAVRASQEPEEGAVAAAREESPGEDPLPTTGD